MGKKNSIKNINRLNEKESKERRDEEKEKGERKKRKTNLPSVSPYCYDVLRVTCSKAALKEAPVQRLLWHGSKMVDLVQKRSPLGLEANYPFNPKLYMKGKKCILKLKI